MITKPTICGIPVETGEPQKHGKYKKGVPVNCKETVFDEVLSNGNEVIGYRCRGGHVHGIPNVIQKPCKECACRNGHAKGCKERLREMDTSIAGQNAKNAMAISSTGTVGVASITQNGKPTQVSASTKPQTPWIDQWVYMWSEIVRLAIFYKDIKPIKNLPHSMPQLDAIQTQNHASSTMKDSAGDTEKKPVKAK